MQLGCSTSQLVDKLYASAKGLPAGVFGADGTTTITGPRPNSKMVQAGMALVIKRK